MMEATTAVMWLTLLAATSPTGDNVTETGVGHNVSWSPFKPPFAFSSPFQISSTLSMVFHVAIIVITVVGTLANGYVLLALLFSKNSLGNVNVFITHQTVLDLTTCAALFVGIFANRLIAEASEAGALFLCWFFRMYAISGIAGDASVAGLMIITIERYVKIVHPVKHRNRYRPWMTRAGIVLPWVFGVCMTVIPNLGTTSIVRGHCIHQSFWPSDAAKLAWSVAKFLLLYVLPISVFVFGYGKMLVVIRRQRAQVADGQQLAGGRSISNAATAAQKRTRRTEMNIIKTMLLVSITFAICFFCMRTYNILTSLRVAPHVGALYSLFSVFSYCSRCLNPFVYATQYEVVRRWWKVMVCRVVRRQNVEESSMSAAATDKAAQRQTTKNI